MFINGAVGGSYPRDWFYMLRGMDVTAERFAAVVIMTTAFHDAEPVAEVDQVSDLALIHPLLRIADLPGLAETFPSADGRAGALKAVLLRGQRYGADVSDFLAHPWKRVVNVSLARRVGVETSRNYPGRAPSLAGLRVDPATGALSIPDGLPAIQTDGLLAHARQVLAKPGPAADRPASAAYRGLWFGRIADLCAAAGVPLFIYRIPRGPLAYLANADERPSGVVRDMRIAGRIRLLPATQFDDLERPEYFFDQLHMNSAGRQIFSAQLAGAVLERLPAQP
jgi:hypothetical protein